MAEQTSYGGYTITIQELTGNLMAGDCTGLDMDQMPRRYCQLLRERVQAAFPGARIEIDLERAEGVCRETRVYSPNGDVDEDLAEQIGYMESELYSSPDWYVELPEESNS